MHFLYVPLKCHLSGREWALFLSRSLHPGLRGFGCQFADRQMHWRQQIRYRWVRLHSADSSSSLCRQIISCPTLLFSCSAVRLIFHHRTTMLALWNPDPFMSDYVWSCMLFMVKCVPSSNACFLNFHSSLKQNHKRCRNKEETSRAAKYKQTHEMSPHRCYHLSKCGIYRDDVSDCCRRIFWPSTCCFSYVNDSWVFQVLHPLLSSNWQKCVSAGCPDGNKVHIALVRHVLGSAVERLFEIQCDNAYVVVKRSVMKIKFQ